MAGGDFCFSHSPAYAEQRARARVKGGHGSSNVARLLKGAPPELADLVEKLKQLLADAESGTLAASTAAACGGLAGRLLDAYRTILDVGQNAETERRLTQLEESLGEGGRS